jgi:hypothetical protein
MAIILLVLREKDAMPISDDFEPIPRRQRGCLSILCWSLLVEMGFTLAGAIFGATLDPGRIDGWFLWKMMLGSSAGALIGIPFAIIAGVAIWQLD